MPRARRHEQTETRVGGFRGAVRLSSHHARCRCARRRYHYDGATRLITRRLLRGYAADMNPTATANCTAAHVKAFLPRDAMLARYLLSSYVRHKPVLYRNDWTNRAAFRHGDFLPPTPHCVGYLQKLGNFSLELFPKLRT